MKRFQDAIWMTAIALSVDNFLDLQASGWEQLLTCGAIGLGGLALMLLLELIID